MMVKVTAGIEDSEASNWACVDPKPPKPEFDIKKCLEMKHYPILMYRGKGKDDKYEEKGW